MGQSAASRQPSAISQMWAGYSSLAEESATPLWAETGDRRPETPSSREAGSGQRGAMSRRETSSSLEDGSWKLEAAPGRVLGLIGRAGSGLTSIGISLLAAATTEEPIAVLDVRGWFCPSLAWEAGIAPERLVIVRCPDPEVWPKVAATLLEGFPAVYAEVPARVPDQALRRLSALARSRRPLVALRAMEGDLPVGVLHLRVEATAVRWEGPEEGHGRLERRAVTVKASGKGAQGVERYLELEEGDGADPVRLVPRLAAAPPGRAAG